MERDLTKEKIKVEEAEGDVQMEDQEKEA